MNELYNIFTNWIYYTSAFLMLVMLPILPNQFHYHYYRGRLFSQGVVNYKLSQLKFTNDTDGIKYINHDHSSLSPRLWKSDHIYYASLDPLHRTSYGNLATLDKNNVIDDADRAKQTYFPSGWHQKIYTGQPVLNRGHEIAYSLSGGIDRKGNFDLRKPSGDQNNPKNLFTQTAFANQELQVHYEYQVKQALLSGKHVVYDVAPVFHDRDKMPQGVHIQAISTDRKLNFNVYLYNVQPKVHFNYKTGKSRVNYNLTVKSAPYAPFAYDNRFGEIMTPQYRHRKRVFGYWKREKRHKYLHHRYMRHFKKYHFIRYSISKAYHKVKEV